MRSEDLPKFSENTAKDLLERLRLVESALENRSRDAAAKNLEELFTCMHQAKIPFSGMQQIGRLLHSFCTSLLLSSTFPMAAYRRTTQPCTAKRRLNWRLNCGQ